MPLPDAPAESPRVYKLFKNTTLENVTNDDITLVGDPISVSYTHLTLPTILRV